MNPEDYGGDWTKKKLDILEEYLNAYTTALKNKPFELAYIDAFAGTGFVKMGNRRDQDAGSLIEGLADQEVDSFIRGSAKRALDIERKPFDKLVFIEEDTARCNELKALKERHSNRDIRIVNSEANAFLRDELNWSRNWRGVLFLDPFVTEVEWSTIKKISELKALDTWILFPIMAISRMLPKSNKPDDIDPKWVERLTKVYGDESWRELYRTDRNLFGYPERDPGVDGFVSIYKNNLQDLLGDRLLEPSRTLRNSKNGPLFEFMFFVGNPKGIDLAKRIAEHIIKKL